jgi:hypothetical protein
MHAVVVSVTVHDRDAAISELHEQVVPTVSGAPGFVAGYWIALPNGKGRGTIVFDSEGAAGGGDNRRRRGGRSRGERLASLTDPSLRDRASRRGRRDARKGRPPIVRGPTCQTAALGPRPACVAADAEV